MKQDGMKIKDLRAELGLSLEEFSEKVGLSSRGRMSVIERDERCSLAVALKIEALSVGPDGAPRIDAADLNDDVAAARHGAGVSAPVAAASTGQSGAMSGEGVVA